MVCECPAPRTSVDFNARAVSCKSNIIASVRVQCNKSDVFIAVDILIYRYISMFIVLIRLTQIWVRTSESISDIWIFDLFKAFD